MAYHSPWIKSSWNSSTRVSKIVARLASNASRARTSFEISVPAVRRSGTMSMRSKTESFWMLMPSRTWFALPAKKSVDLRFSLPSTLPLELQKSKSKRYHTTTRDKRFQTAPRYRSRPSPHEDPTRAILNYFCTPSNYLLAAQKEVVLLSAAAEYIKTTETW